MVYESVDKKDIILICFDPNNQIDNFRIQFNQINVDIIFHTEFESCLTHIQSFDKQKIFFVTSSSQISSQFISLQSIHSIFIFHFDNHPQKYLFFENPKVIGIYDNIDSLCSSIQEQINFIGQKIPLWCFFDQNEYANRDLYKDSSHFLWFQLSHDVLLCLSHDEQAKKQMIETCRYYYQDYPEELLFIDEFEQKYDGKEAIHWFLNSSFLQKIIQEALLNEHTILLYTLRYFLADLLEDLAHKHQQNILLKRDKLTVYRQMKLSKEELKQLQDNQGQLILMKEFLIAYTDRSSALSLSTLSEEQTEFTSVLFEIECNIKELGGSLICTDITQFNETILFDFNTTFQLETIRQDKQIWIIKLIAVNNGRSILQKYIDDTHRQLEDLSIPIMFGKFICDMSDWKQSQEYFERLINDSPEEDASRIEYYIGQANYWQGDWKKSRQFYDRAYSRMMDAKSLRIKDSALVLASIGDVLHREGKYDEASNFHQQAFTIRKQYYGHRHIRTTYSLANIGMEHVRQRNYDKASDLFKQVLAIREEYYNCSHIDIAGNLIHIGSVLNGQRKHDEAFDYFQRALFIYEKYYASSYALITLTLNPIGHILSTKKKYSEAIKYIERSLTLQKRIYPYGHICIATSLFNLGVVKYQQGKYDESLELYQQALELEIKYFSFGHFGNVRIFNAIGIAQLYGKGNYDEALNYHQQALTTLKTNYPSYINLIGITLECIGNVSRKQLKNDEALILYQQALKMQEDFYLYDHVDMFSILKNIGYILNDQGKYDEALNYQQRALTIGQKYYSSYHIDIANHLRIIGSIKSKQRKFDEAFDYYNRALVIFEEYYPMHYTEIANCLGAIESILYQKSEYIRAIEYLEKRLKIDEALLSQDRLRIIRILSNFGLLQKLCRQYELSLTYQLKCLSIREQVLPPDHQDIGKSLSSIGACYEQLNQIKIALEYYKRASVIYEQCLPSGHVDRKYLGSKIALLCKRIENIHI